jgi:hypothetical protein
MLNYSNARLDFCPICEIACFYRGSNDDCFHFYGRANMLGRTIKRMAAGIAVAASLLLLGTTEANAALSQCSAGYACIWGENSYTGCFYQRSTSGPVGDWATCAGVSSINGANSLKANGNTCNTDYYDLTNQTGPYIRFLRAGLGSNFQDPTLSNGGGSSTGYEGQNWQDRIGSLKFVC